MNIDRYKCCDTCSHDRVHQFVCADCSQGSNYQENITPSIEGIGMDAPTVENANGGRQSQLNYRFDKMDPKSIFEMCKVLHEGVVKYGDDENWRKISIEDHLNHLLMHVLAYLAGDRSDGHLSHTMCRAMFAQGVAIQEEENIQTIGE